MKNKFIINSSVWWSIEHMDFLLIKKWHRWWKWKWKDCPSKTFPEVICANSLLWSMFYFIVVHCLAVAGDSISLQWAYHVYTIVTMTTKAHDASCSRKQQTKIVKLWVKSVGNECSDKLQPMRAQETGGEKPGGGGVQQQQALHILFFFFLVKFCVWYLVISCVTSCVCFNDER